eukprot:jgi/Chrzof1/15256/UNPLg00650.t1
MLDAEQRSYGDILLLPTPDLDSPDPPPSGQDSATTLKVMYALKWATERYHFNYFVRLGDDAFFRVDYFLQASKSWPLEKLYRGMCTIIYSFESKDKKVPKNTVSYCQGMGFALSYDAAEYVAANFDMLQKGWPEDAVVGSWFVGTLIQARHDDRFHEFSSGGCGNTSIIVHMKPNMNTPTTVDLWQRINNDTGVLQC